MTTNTIRASTGMRPFADRTFDYLLSLSFASWATLGWLASDDRGTIARLAISTLHLSVAIAILFRRPLTRLGSPGAMAASVPALVVSGLVLRSSAPPREWELALSILFSCGAAASILSFAALGRNFAVLPALRGVVTHGPYRLVRHPAYAGELVMIAACVGSRPTPWAMFLLAIALPLVALRIRAEEGLLTSALGYREYRQKVPWRLLPGVW